MSDSKPSVTTPPELPTGYELFPLDNSFNDAFSPIFMQLSSEGPKLALKVEKHHLNPMGICHGAVYMALFDIGFAAITCFNIGKFTGTPTMSITVDYIGASKEGELLHVDTESLKTTRTAGFCRGIIRNSQGDIKANGSGLFKLPNDIDAAEGITIAELQALSKK